MVTSCTSERLRGVLISNDQVNNQPNQIGNKNSDRCPKPWIHPSLQSIVIYKPADKERYDDEEEEYTQRQEHKQHMNLNISFVVQCNADQFLRKEIE